MRRNATALGLAALWLVAAACGPSDTDNQSDASTNHNVVDAEPDAETNRNDAGANQNDAGPGLDTDGDGVPDASDPCPTDPQQWTDADGDGHCDELDDDCPTDPNGWDDTNNDGLCNGDDDSDGDGITNGEEVVYGGDCAISSPDATDTDADGIPDNEDPYPRDPFPEFILHRNDTGTIDLMLSNRDGTFQAPVEIGAPHGCTSDAPHNCPANTDYRYLGFVITDFDNNGRTDFLAVGDADPADPNNLRDLWWFTRTGTITTSSPTTFDQRLVDSGLDRGIFGVAADFNNDERIDLIAMEITKPANITAAYVYSYENTGLLATASCAYTTDPVNPNGCAFIRRLGADLDRPTTSGTWGGRGTPWTWTATAIGTSWSTPCRPAGMSRFPSTCSPARARGRSPCPPAPCSVTTAAAAAPRPPTPSCSPTSTTTTSATSSSASTTTGTRAAAGSTPGS